MTVIQGQEKNTIWVLLYLFKRSDFASCREQGRDNPSERSSLYFHGKLKRTQLIYHTPSLRSNLHKPFIILTSPQICWCCQVGKIIQADNINDWTHHSGIILREREKEGGIKGSGFLECPGKLPEIRKHKVAHVNLCLASPICFWQLCKGSVATKSKHGDGGYQPAALHGCGEWSQTPTPRDAAKNQLFISCPSHRASITVPRVLCLLSISIDSTPSAQPSKLAHYHQPRNYQTPNNAFS